MLTGSFSRLLGFCFMAMAMAACHSAQKVQTNKNGWVSLFNGRDINDWIVKIHHHDVGDNFGNTFRVEDSMIKVRYDQYGPFNDQFGHLYYKTPFSYYHLVVEYRFTGEWKKDAPDYTLLNSGIMFHSQDPRTMPKEQDWPISIEFSCWAASVMVSSGLPGICVRRARILFTTGCSIPGIALTPLPKHTMAISGFAPNSLYWAIR